MENVQIIAYRFNGNPDELMHYRTKGSKNGIRLYQYKDGSLTPAGREHYGVGKPRGEGGSDESAKRRSLGQVIKDHKTAKKRAENLAKARAAKAAKKQAAEEEAKKKAEQEAAEAKEREEIQKKGDAFYAEKERVIKTGSAAEALNWVGVLTPAERDYITKRIEWEKSMQSITAKEVAEDKSKVDEFFKSMDKAVNYAQTGAKMYNTVANVINAFNGERVMPKIETNITNGNKKDIKDRKKEIQKAQEAAAKRAKQEAEGDAKRAERDAKKNKDKNKSNKDQTKTEGSKVHTGTVEGEGKSKSNIKNDSNNTKKDKSSDYYSPIDMYEGEVPVKWQTKSGNTYRDVTINGVTIREYIDRL